MLQRLLEDGAVNPVSPPAKYVAPTDPLYEYIERHRSRVDPLLTLRADRVVRRRRPYAHQLEQGDFLTR